MSKGALDCSTLCIVRCSAAQVRQTRINTSAEWGVPKGFTVDSWTKVYDGWSDRIWAEGDRFVTWALVPRSDPNTLDLLAHCETYRRNSVYIPPGSSQLVDTFSYCIACVYCPPTHRGKSYAKHLLSLLHYVIAPTHTLPPFPSTWGAAPTDIHGFRDASFSDLYSGIGDKYYETCRKGDGKSTDSEKGWVHQKLLTRIWRLGTLNDKIVEESHDWEWLKAEDMAILSQTLSQNIRVVLPTRGDKSKTRIAILPDDDLLGYHSRRDYLEAQGRNLEHFSSERTYGLVVSTLPNGSPVSFITYVFADPSTLIVTHVQHPVPFTAVLAAARREKCDTVEMWARGEFGRDEWDREGGGAIVDEKKNVPCLAQYGLDGGDDNVEWHWLERYTWC